MPACLWRHRVCRALGPQVVGGGGVCVRLGVCALFCCLIFAVCIERDFRVSKNQSGWVGVLSGAFLQSRVRIVSCNWLCYIYLVL
jgi:hypothetical protein